VTKCRICGAVANWSWQPFGPAAEAPRSGFTRSGWHYRGFPVVPVCESCKRDIEHDVSVAFAWRGQHYALVGDEVQFVGEV
jgi:hypothetical protein